jgi:hypothetical protein
MPSSNFSCFYEEGLAMLDGKVFERASPIGFARLIIFVKKSQKSRGTRTTQKTSA